MGALIHPVREMVAWPLMSDMVFSHQTLMSDARIRNHI